MKNKIIYLTLLLLLSMVTTPILAQEECDTKVTQAQIDYMNATREIRESLKASQLKSNEVYIIPMVAHIVRENDATGGLTETQLSIAMLQLNEAFEQADFEFELCEIKYIDNSDYMTIRSSKDPNSDEFIMATNNRVADKVNVFFVSGLKKSSGNGTLCGASSFPSYLGDYGEDWIMMRNDCTTDGSTFAHELGHWFNLYHTFQGDSEDLGVTEDELVVRGAGQNCGQIGVGDELCDTPADPQLGADDVTSDCIYIGTYTDTNTDAYTPDVSNLMGYGRRACRNFFSPEQIERMRTSYLVDRMSLLSACTTSLSCSIVGISVNNTTACNDNGTPDDMTDDYFVGDVSVNYFGNPNTGKLYLGVTGGASDINTAEFSSYRHTFTGVNIPANTDKIVTMTAVFSATPSCRFTDDVDTGRNCGPCNITAVERIPGYNICRDNDTPNDATDDFFIADIDVYYEEQPASGHLVLEGGVVNHSVPVSELSYDNGHYVFDNVSLPANGIYVSLTANFSAEPSCSKTSNFGGMRACSIDGICDGENADIATSIISGRYVREVSNTITASNVINFGTDVTYKAGQKIILQPDFHAKNNSKFHAYIEDCTTNDGSKEEIIDTEPISLRNYPNPFTEQTTIEFVLTQDTPVTLFVSDVTGRRVAVLLNNEAKTQGTHSITFDGNNYPAGMYYYTIQAGELYGTQKMILAK